MTTQHPATLPTRVAEDWDGHLWRLPVTTDRHARSRPCAHPDCLWLVTIHHDHDTGTWTLIHDCDHDQARAVVSTGHHHWQDAARHAFTLELPHPEAFA